MNRAVKAEEYWTVTMFTQDGDTIDLPPCKTFDEAMAFVKVMSQNCPKSTFTVEGPDTYSFVF